MAKNPWRTSLEDWVRKQLEKRRAAYKAGSLPALYDAFHLCRRDDVPPESWMLDEAMACIARLYKADVATGKGRTGNPRSRTNQDSIHFIRYDEVLIAREEQERRAEDVKKAQRLGWNNADIETHLKKGVGTTLDDAFETASRRLQGTRAQGSPRQMKESWQKVKRDFKDPHETAKYLALSPATRRDLGIPDPDID